VVFVQPKLDVTPPMHHSILVEVHVNLAVLFVTVPALIIFGFDFFPVRTTCLIETGDGVYAVLFVTKLALLKFGFDLFLIDTTCLIETGDGIYARDLPKVTPAHVLKCLPLGASDSYALAFTIGLLFPPSQHKRL
jgi:hypothetical protein